MDENLNVVNDTQEQSVDVQDSIADVDSGEVNKVADEQTTVENQNSEVAKPKQTANENAKFAEYRREKEQIEAKNQRLLKALGLFGYEGLTEEEIADKLEAQATGKDVETVKSDREKTEKETEKIKVIEQEKEFYKKLAIEKLKADDLSKIKSAYPDLKEKSVDEFGEGFLKLINAGVDPVSAYEVINKQKEKATIKAPVEIGAVSQSATKEKDFYSPSDVDKLTQADFKRDPTLLGKVQKSMTKWK